MNINAVITHLIEMTPGQRKQFAQLHMDDPMMLSAAKFVDNQINKQAQSLAAQATGAAPPPVNQQVVASMTPQQPAPQQPAQQLPEDVGIAQLPAPNMEKVVRAAGGGIMTFAKGGVNDALEAIDKNMPDPGVDMSGFNRFNGSMADYLSQRAKAIQSVRSNFPEQATYTSPSRSISAFQEDTSPKQALTQEAIDAYKKTYGRVPQFEGTPAPVVNDRTPRTPSIYKPEAPVSPAARKDDRPNLSSLKGQTEKPLPSQGGTRTAPVSQAPQAPQADSSEKPGGLEALLKGYQNAQGPAVDPYAAQHEESRKSREQMALDEMAGAKERQAGIEKLLSGKEARIAKREERLNEQDDTNLNMSLINAGLAMMQSTGKGLAGIAEGAQKGVGQYTEGLKMSEAARQKIEDARDAHDELRFNLNNMSSKEIQAAKRSMEEGKIASTNEAITSLMQERGLNRADATALFAARVNQMAADKQMAHAEKLNALSIAAAAGNAAASRDLQRELANKPGETQKMLTALGGGDINKGYDIYTRGRQEGGMDKVRLTQAEKWLDNNMNNPAFNKNADAELWNQAKAVVSSSFMPILDSSKVNGPILQKPQR
jgi:hypothetical protein